MGIFLVFILLGTLPLTLGCPTDPDDDDISGDDDTTEDDFHAAITARSPEDIVGMFYINNAFNADCGETHICLFMLIHDGPYWINFEVGFALFLTKDVYVTEWGSNTQVRWSTENGEWGMAPFETYDLYGGACDQVGELIDTGYEAATSVEGNSIVLTGLIGELYVYGSEFENLAGTVNGIISYDLLKIEYTDEMGDTNCFLRVG